MRGKRLLALVLALLILVSFGFVGQVYSAVKFPPLPPVDRGGMNVDWIELSVVPKVTDDGIVLEFYVENTGSQTVVLTFNTSQTFDYWLMGNGFFYHYAEGKYFLQVITHISLRPGEKKLIGSDRIRLKAGEYRLDAQLKGYPDVRIGGYLRVNPDKGIAEFERDLIRGVVATGLPIALKVNVPSYVVSRDSLVGFDIYLVNTSSKRVIVELPTRPVKLTIFGGYSMYFAYTSAYDTEGKYLKILVSAKEVELSPGGSIKLGVFEWDQTANVKGGISGPYYRVHVSLNSATLTVSGKKFGVKDDQITVVFPLYKREDMKPLNVPAWAEEFATYATENGLLIPNSDRGIDFSKKATRRQVVFAVASSVGIEPTSAEKPPFRDVKLYDPMLGILSSMKKAGLLKGYPDGTVRLDNTVTRAEAVSLFVRAILYKFNLWEDFGVKKCGFVDVKDSSWYAPYVCYAYKLGLVKGTGQNRFEPLNSITVAQLSVLATTAHRLMDMLYYHR